MNNLHSKDFFEQDFDIMFKNNNAACVPDFHFHDSYEIFYCIRGGKQYMIEDNIYSLDPGNLFIINNFEIHKPIRDPEDNYRRIVIIFKPERIKEICPKHFLSLLSCFTSRKNGKNNKINLNVSQQNVFLEIINRISKLQEDEFAYQALLESYYIELLVYVNRWYRSNFDESAKNMGSYDFNPTVKSIIDFLNDNYSNNINLDSIAEEFHMEKHYMCQLFKNTTGTTINRYIISRRLARSKVLLHQGYNVTETSTLSGFQNYSHFIRTFKKHFGKSPMQFIKSSKSLVE